MSDPQIRIFGRHRNLVNAIVDSYLNDFQQWLSDYDFTLLDKNNSGKHWRGKVCVELFDDNEGTYVKHDHIVIINLPVGFPYQTPFVISDDDPPLEPSLHLSPVPVNSLCLWTPTSNWQPHFTAEKLLKRIQDWFIAYHTKSWPLASEMPDLHLYLPQKGSVIFGDDFQPPEKVFGKFNLWHDTTFAQRNPAIATTELGVMNWENASQLHKSLYVDFRQYKRTPGVRVQINKPFVPDRNLASLLDRLDIELGIASGQSLEEFRKCLGVKTKAQGLAIALSYRYSDESRWLFLWGEFPENRKKYHKWANNSELSQIQLKSLKPAPAGELDLIRRSAYISKSIKNSRVCIFGVGALGGTVSLLLAKAGIGQITLVDHDTLMPGNVIRHVCGLGYVGNDKQIATSLMINQHNPYCNVIMRDSTWDPNIIFQYIESCDLVIDTTANKNFSLLLNDVCISHKKAVVFGAAFRRARIGRIISHVNNNDPCLACYGNTSIWSVENYPVVPPSQEETFIEDGCGSVTEEATALDVEAVANFITRKVIKILQRQDDAANLGFIVNEPIKDTGIPIFQEPGLYWILNQPASNCAICSL